MFCKKCGTKTKVIDSRMNKSHPDELLRKHKCPNEDCGYEFFSVEFEVENNDSFIKQWKYSARGVGR